jgi:hypothetical protein
MTKVGGTIKIGEAMPTAGATGRRQRGGIWWYWVLMLVLVLGLGFFGLWLSNVADINPTIGWLAGALTGMLLYSRWSKLLLLWRFRRTQAAKGVPLDVDIAVEITDEAIVYRIGDLTTHAKWRAVTEVFPEKGWWIVMAQSSSMFIADRFFANEDDKRAFLRELMLHVSDDARARSPEAVKVAGG